MINEIDNITLLKDLKTENEDINIVIDKSFKMPTNMVFESCNIFFKLNEGGNLTIKEQTVSFIDCNIVFIGNNGKVAISSINSKLLFDNCVLDCENMDSSHFMNYIVATGVGTVTINECTVNNIVGRFIQTKGVSAFVEDCIINTLSGEFINVCCDEGSKNSYPSLLVSNSHFTKCVFPLKNKEEYQNTGKIEPAYCGTNSPSLIDGHEVLNSEINNCIFDSCKLMCIRLQNSNLTNPGIIKKCTFKNCNPKISDDYLSIFRETEAYSIWIRKVKVRIEECLFNNTLPIYVHAQYSQANISNCSFKNIKMKGVYYNKGIIYIFNEIDEPIFYINNCNFESCVIEDKYDEGDSGMIYITAGEPNSSQVGTVTIENCNYKNCEAGVDIHGRVKSDGFFSKTYVLFKEI